MSKVTVICFLTSTDIKTHSLYNESIKIEYARVMVVLRKANKKVSVLKSSISFSKDSCCPSRS